MATDLPMSTVRPSAVNQMSRLDLPLKRDVSTRMLIGQLSGTLQDVAGVEEAAGRRCPFGDKVLDRPALCMMTTSSGQLRPKT